VADPVAEYVDPDGNTWQLNEADAKRLGYAKVGTKAAKADQVETKVVETDAPSKPAARRTATTK
jgi:hypothetical protein